MEQKYRTRTFEEGDETALATLFNVAYEKYSGFVPRTSDYWLWCCRKRPDVEAGGIVVVEDNQTRKVVGYAVVGKSGNIWEICVDPSTERRGLLSILFERANEYLKKVDGEQIVLNVPSNDLAMQEICSQMNFSELRPDQMFVGIADFEAFVEALTKNAKEKLAGFNEIVTIELLNARQWINPIFSVKVDGEIQVLPNSISNSIRIIIDSDIFTSIILGKTTPLATFMKGKLKVKPLRKVSKALKFLNALQLDNIWFFPLADFG